MHIDPYDVCCPACHAAFGRKCWSKARDDKGRAIRQLKPHPERIEAKRELVEWKEKFLRGSEPDG